MTKTRSATAVATATICLAAALILIGMVSGPSLALRVFQTDESLAIKSELDHTFAIEQAGKALATKSTTVDGLEMIQDDRDFIPAINEPLVATPGKKLSGKPGNDDFAPKSEAKNAFDTNPVSNPLATKLGAYDLFAIKLANNIFPTRPATSNAVGIMLDGYPLALGLSGAFVAKSADELLFAELPTLFGSKPPTRDTLAAASDTLAGHNWQLPAAPNGGAFISGPAAKKASDVTPASDASATKLAVKYPVAVNPNSPKSRIRNPMAISKAIMENKWQYWQYCLAAARAEHKIYFSPPIPLSGYLNGADSEFKQLLIRAGLNYDAVQCPRAPNKPTLLFRQKYSISFNKEIGNTIINVSWDN